MFNKPIPTCQLILLLMATVCLTSFAGCARRWYRNSADSEVYSIISEKGSDPRWPLERVDITPAESSRIFDPTDLDCPPLPPDDETASRSMSSPGGFRGAPLWNQIDRVDFVENPNWTAYLSMGKDGEPELEKLTLPQAIELSLVHSREYQNQIENLYLAALALTFERYRLTTRPLGFSGEPGSGLFYQNQPEGQSNLDFGTTTLGFSRLFPGGAQLIAELANSTLWMFSGGDTTSTASSIAFSLVQPLLRGGQREIALERLTQSERNVLYAVRDFARFRKQFFVSTITGGQVAGLQRFLGSFGFLPGSSAAPRVGFYPLLLELQQLRNRQNTSRTVEYLISDLNAEGASELDIARLESTLADTLGDLVRDQRVFSDRLDQYKVQLGLPPDLSVALDDSLLKPFQFTDPVLVATEQSLREFSRALRERKNESEAIDQDLRDMIRKLALATGQSGEIVSADFRRLQDSLPNITRRMDSTDARKTREIIGQEAQRLQVATAEIKALNERADRVQVNAKVEAIESLRADLLLVLRKLSVIQIIGRVQLVPLRPFDITLDEVSDLTVDNRLDLMNQRARVMDARRRLEIAADQLESKLDVVLEGSVNTKPLSDGPNNPFDFRAKESEFRAGIQFDTPLDQVRERNAFRAAQISYQQAKRSYIGIEDNIKLDVRQAVRTLEAKAKEITKRQRRIQYTARELELAETRADPTQRGLSLNSALRTLNFAQDELIEGWLDYETTRLNLYRDTGLMQINERGFWEDEFYVELFGQ